MEINRWYLKVRQTIEANAEQIPPKEVKFFHIPRLIRAAELTEKYAPACRKCDHNKDVITDLAENLIDYTSHDSSSRRKYERQFDIFVAHLRKEHGVYPKGYYAAYYALLGVLIATPVFVLAAYLILQGNLQFFGLIGFALGLFLGRLLGARKDKQLLEANLYL